MNDTELNAQVEYASDIVQLAIEGNHDNNTVMNGLAIAAAAMLLDMVTDEKGVAGNHELAMHVEAFEATLHHAIAFAKQQVDAGLLVNEN